MVEDALVANFGPLGIVTIEPKKELHILNEVWGGILVLIKMQIRLKHI